MEPPKRVPKIKVLNPAKVVMTVKGTHRSDGKYSKFSGDAYQLAEMMSSRTGTCPPRPFMERAKWRFAGPDRKKAADFLKMSIDTKIHLSNSVKKEKGVWIDWNAFGEWCAAQIHSWLLDGKLGLTHLKKKTVERKERAGYGNTPVYASGQLAEMISWTVVSDGA